MKKILFIVPYPIGIAPSQRFRFEQYFELLKSYNIYYEISPFWTEKGWQIIYKKGKGITKALFLVTGLFKRIFLLLKIYKYNMVFIHREAMPVGPPLMEFIIIKILKKNVIFDFDDAIWLSNTSSQNSIASRFKYHQKVQMICKWSWKVSCGNEFLADFVRKYNPKVCINPTTIDVNYHKSSGENSNIQNLTIGWTGTHSTTKYLNLIAPILKELKEKYTIDILIISNKRPDWDLKDYDFVQWNLEQEIKLLERIDIGIMPLTDTIWEKGKCGFKILQYMAMSKPTVASNIGVNKTIIDHNINGFLCHDINDWREYLVKLISSKSLRLTMGEQGRKKVIENYSVQSNKSLFLSLFE